MNFENWSIIGEDIDKSKVSHFYGSRCSVIHAEHIVLSCVHSLGLIAKLT